MNIKSVDDLVTLIETMLNDSGVLQMALDQKLSAVKASAMLIKEPAFEFEPPPNRCLLESRLYTIAERLSNMNQYQQTIIDHVRL